MDQITKKHAEKIRFFIVGAGNRGLDFSVLFMLTFVGFDKIAANYASTGIALVFSFIANKTFTFQNKEGSTKKQLPVFLAVTLAGLWILQPIIIWGVTSTLPQTIESDGIRLFVAKILATVASLVWNYIFYSRLVFKNKRQE